MTTKMTQNNKCLYRLLFHMVPFIETSMNPKRRKLPISIETSFTYIIQQAKWCFLNIEKPHFILFLTIKPNYLS